MFPVHDTHRRKGAASLNDMKDMLASLPQYQEMREKVVPRSDIPHAHTLTDCAGSSPFI
jgi:hypothetical protein